MQIIKVLLASRPKILCDVIKNLVGCQPDMQVVGEVVDPIELLIAIRAMTVDAVVVTPLDSKEPKICRHLLKEDPGLVIVTLSAKGEAAFLYQSNSKKKRIDQPDAQSILDAMRESINQIQREKNS